MRALLVNPHWGAFPGKKGPVYERRFPPVELANIASLLAQKGIEVTLLDANAEKMPAERIKAIAAGHDLAYVTSSNLDKWCCPDLDTRPFEAAARAVSSEVERTYLLGAHATARPGELLARTGGKAAIIGEPELTAVALADAAEPEGVAGAAWLDAEGACVAGPKQTPVDLDALPPPAHHRLPRGRYAYEPLGGDFMVFELSRGCTYSCSFCHKSLYGSGRRAKSPERLVEEVVYATRHLGVQNAYFMDLEFTRDRDRVLDLCERLIALGSPLRWCCQTRVDIVDTHLLDTMKRAGCVLVHYGVESGSEQVMADLDKGINLEQVVHAVNLTRSQGLRTACFFMLGFPGETEDDFRATIKLSHRLDPTYATFHVAVPYPGTRLARDSDTVGGDLFPTHFEGEFSLEQLQGWARRATLEYYLRPGYAARRALGGELNGLARLVPIFLWYAR